MPSFTTVFRAIVMLLFAVLLVKGWQSYGLSAEQLKSIAMRALEATTAGSTLSNQPAEQNSGVLAEVRETTPLAPPLVNAAVSNAQSAQQSPDVGSNFGTAVEPAAFANPNVSEAGSAGPNGNILTSASDAAHLSALLERLEALGGIEPKLTAWGTTGELYRFSCRAAIADTPTFARHFESVSSKPRTAMEDVLAKVEAWRTAHLYPHRVQ